MKIRIEFPPGVQTGAIAHSDGSIVAIELTPEFAGHADLAVVATITVINDHGKQLDCSLLKVSGVSGKLGRKGREPVKALADMTDEERDALKSKDTRRARRQDGQGVGGDDQPALARVAAGRAPGRAEPPARVAPAAGK